MGLDAWAEHGFDFGRDRGLLEREAGLVGVVELSASASSSSESIEIASNGAARGGAEPSAPGGWRRRGWVLLPMLLFVALRLPSLVHAPGFQDEQWISVPGWT